MTTYTYDDNILNGELPRPRLMPSTLVPTPQDQDALAPTSGRVTPKQARDT